MTIELPRNNFGITIFFTILIIFQIFFGIIGSIIANFFKLTGIWFWLFIIGFVFIIDLFFIDVK